MVAVAITGALLLTQGTSSAATATGTLSISATVAGSIEINFNSDASGIALGGSGSSAGSIAFGTVSAYGGSLPTGVTRTINGATSFTLSTPFDLNVAQQDSTSTSYTVTAALATGGADEEFKIDSVTLSTSPQTITTIGSYATNQPHTFSLTIPFTDTSGSGIANTIDFVVTAN